MKLGRGGLLGASEVENLLRDQDDPVNVDVKRPMTQPRRDRLGGTAHTMQAVNTVGAGERKTIQPVRPGGSGTQ